MRRFLVVLFLLALLLVGFTALDVSRPATPPGETILEVVPGMGTRAIGAMLAQHGIIRNQYTFDLWHVLRGGTLKAGEYQFLQAATLPAVYNRIVHGDVYTRAVTIPEGFNLFDIAQAVQDAQERITDSHALSMVLSRQHALNLVTGLSMARTGARVSYATSLSISDARALLAAAAVTLDDYFAQAAK